MSNVHKGEVTFEAGGKLQTLRLDTNALCALEEDLNIGVGEMAVLLDGGRISVMRACIRVGVVNGNGTTASMTLEEAGNLIDEIGYQRAMDLISKTLERTFTPQQEGEEPNPPTAGAGTGKRSSSSGSQPA